MDDIKAIDAAELITRVLCRHIETGASVKVFGAGGVSYSQGILYPIYRCFPNRQSVIPFMHFVRMNICDKLNISEEMIEISNKEYE